MRAIHSCAALAAALALASPAGAQYRMEWGVDAAAVFGFGDVSTAVVDFPAARVRLGFFQPGARLEPETTVGFSYADAENVEGIWTYSVQLGALYHFRPVRMLRADRGSVTAESFSPYLRPFAEFTGLSGGDEDDPLVGDDDIDDSDVILGLGIGTRLRWRQDLAWRFEANLGYGFDNEALRVGLLAGLSFFPR